MTELVRRALMGDKKSQEECTEKGIMLPCPCCGGNAYDAGRYIISIVKCNTCGLEASYSSDIETDIGVEGLHYKETPEYKVRLKWNTRSALPIGKCDDCNHRYENELNEYVCEILDICSDDNFCCSYFEPKDRE